KVALWAGLKAAENRFLKRGLYSSILAPFSRIDFRQLSIPPKGQLLHHFGYNPLIVSFALKWKRYTQS
ncbi:MAG TPA: hypothetical protein VLE95_00660, partial [Chlamydiales bacterium]|nr:hypothetical protein [Chlamydiales bacterium]